MNRTALPITLTLAILAVLILAMAAIYSNEIEVWWAYHAQAARLDKELGFQGGTLKAQFPTMKASEEVFAIVSVVPGGIAEHAGLRSGDIPVNISPCVYFLPPEGSIYARIWNGRGTTIKVPVVNRADVGPGWSDRIRVIDLPAPKE
jgi:hypothetical protein